MTIEEMVAREIIKNRQFIRQAQAFGYVMKQEADND